MDGARTECSCVKCVQPNTTPQQTTASGFASPRPRGGDPNIEVSLQAHEEISERVSSLVKTTYYASTYEPPANYVIEPFGSKLSPDKLHDGVKFGGIVEKYQNQPSFLPRKGELVLFYIDTEPNCELYFEEPLQHLKVYSHFSERVLGHPKWKAAVVCNEPVERLGIEDLKCNFTSSDQSGRDHRRYYEVEVYEDQGQIHMMDLSHIRPLGLFHEILSGIEQIHWHKSIINALLKMNTACVVEPLMCFGEWPRVAITFNGAWLGSELFVVGDVVRIKDGIRPAGAEAEEERDCVVRIHQIAWEFCLDGCSDPIEEPQVIKVRGEVLSTRYRKGRSRHVNDDMLNAMGFSTSALSSLRGYDWFEVEPTDSSGYTNVAADCILGRLYEGQAMDLFIGSRRIVGGSSGVEGAREFAGRQTKGQVLPEEYSSTGRYHWDELNWLLCKDRLEALQLKPHGWRRWNCASLSSLWIEESRENLKAGGGESSPKGTEVDDGSVNGVAVDY
jgi:Transcription-silencing protein Clr2